MSSDALAGFTAVFLSLGGMGIHALLSEADTNCVVGFFNDASGCFP